MSFTTISSSLNSFISISLVVVLRKTSSADGTFHPHAETPVVVISAPPLFAKNISACKELQPSGTLSDDFRFGETAYGLTYGRAGIIDYAGIPQCPGNHPVGMEPGGARTGKGR